MNVSAFPVHGPVRDFAHVSSAFGKHNGSETVGTVISKFTGENLGSDSSNSKALLPFRAVLMGAGRQVGHLGLDDLRLQAQYQADRSGPHAGLQCLVGNHKSNPELSPLFIYRSGVELSEDTEKLASFSYCQFNEARAPAKDSRGAKRSQYLLPTLA